MDTPTLCLCGKPVNKDGATLCLSCGMAQADDMFSDAFKKLNSALEKAAEHATGSLSIAFALQEILKNSKTSKPSEDTKSSSSTTTSSMPTANIIQPKLLEHVNAMERQCALIKDAIRSIHTSIAAVGFGAKSPMMKTHAALLDAHMNTELQVSNLKWLIKDQINY